MDRSPAHEPLPLCFQSRYLLINSRGLSGCLLFCQVKILDTFSICPNVVNFAEALASLDASSGLDVKGL
jgi:hypothetical protein